MGRRASAEDLRLGLPVAPPRVSAGGLIPSPFLSGQWASVMTWAFYLTSHPTAARWDHAWADGWESATLNSPSVTVPPHLRDSPLRVPVSGVALVPRYLPVGVAQTEFLSAPLPCSGVDVVLLVLTVVSVLETVSDRPRVEVAIRSPTGLLFVAVSPRGNAVVRTIRGCPPGSGGTNTGLAGCLCLAEGFHAAYPRGRCRSGCHT